MFQLQDDPNIVHSLSKSILRWSRLLYSAQKEKGSIWKEGNEIWWGISHNSRIIRCGFTFQERIQYNSAQTNEVLTFSLLFSIYHHDVLQNPKFYSSTDPGKNNSALKLTEWQRKVTAINRSIGCILCDPSKSQRLEGPEESKDNQGMDGCNKCWTQQANRKIIKGTFRRTTLNLKNPPVTFGLHFLLFFDLSVAIKLCKWISFVCKRDIPKRNRGRSWSLTSTWNKNLLSSVFLHSTIYATTIIYLSLKESFNYLKWNLLIWWTTSN